ncbi:hypothetical protein [Paraburkholderia sp. CNPSo 3281]|uniref:hypothetical protein n=1 Tax=Paraburkholderia sp. CNPSo 3281 TaxID=2940933 RepID=UPI0020B72104|nr:hypothetical protein [Paraburkholderia sp. CNPSo 3281]MCP3715441.1 hypothetical protein [Paraburkholderia sp. CNPSo 3281]
MNNFIQIGPDVVFSSVVLGLNWYNWDVLPGDFASHALQFTRRRKLAMRAAGYVQVLVHD